MTDLLQQLKQQAGIQDNPDQEGLDQFAELIILECVKVADAEHDTSAGCGYITRSIGDDIIEHFGLR